MASVTGGQFHFSTGHEQVTGSNQGAAAGHLSLASIADYHTTVAGGGDTVGSAGSGASGAGFDTVNGPQQGGGVTPPAHGASDNVVATHSQAGNTVVHLPDGSSITVVGVNHIDASFFH